ncbi:MAG: AtpZ/AtpI family protein [Campylobacterales bacterium]
MSSSSNEPKYKKLVGAADSLSLGISVVVAILIGVGIGFWLKSIFDSIWLLWLGVFWGVAAAFLNIYKAYKKQVKEYDTLAQDPRYSNKKNDKPNS